MRRGPRRLHKAYAKLMGYFWLPCPKCGRMFGGHESTAQSVIWDMKRTTAGYSFGKSTCGKC